MKNDADLLNIDLNLFGEGADEFATGLKVSIWQASFHLGGKSFEAVQNQP